MFTVMSASETMNVAGGKCFARPFYFRAKKAWKPVKPVKKVCFKKPAKKFVAAPCRFKKFYK